MQEQKKYNLADGNIRKRFVTYKQLQNYIVWE